MINSLLRLLGDYDFGYLENRLNDGLERLKKTFGAAFTSFDDMEDHYELVMDVADDAKASNVTVDYEDETRELTVEYKYETESFKNRSVFKETLPQDADPDTIEAIVEDGQLTITIEKLEEPEEEQVEEEEVDDRVVKVNRK